MSEKGNINKTSNGSTLIQWVLAILVNTTLVTYGLQAGWISPMTEVLQSNHSPIGGPLSNSEVSWIASILCIFATVGVPIYTYLADAYGRKWSVIAVAVPQAICWLLKIYMPSKNGLIMARIFCGLASGGCFNIIPMYVKEISQDNMRGTLGSLLTFSQNIGYFLIYLLGAYLDYSKILYVVVWLPILTTLMMLAAPESPAYLVKTGRFEDALATTALLRGLSTSDKGLQIEIENMRNDDQHYKDMPNLTLTTILKNKPWKCAFLILLVIMTAQASNGAFAVVTFGSTVMAASDLPISPQLQTLSIPIVMLIGSLTALSSVEKFGRRLPLGISFAITSVAMAGLASILLVQAQGLVVPGLLVVLTVVVPVFAYAAGVTTIPFILMSEMFNFQIRAKLMGCIMTYAWFISFIQISVFGPVSSALGISTMFFIFAAINILGATASLVLLPETKGKSVEEIEDELRKR